MTSSSPAISREYEVAPDNHAASSAPKYAPDDDTPFGEQPDNSSIVVPFERSVRYKSSDPKYQIIKRKNDPLKIRSSFKN